MAERGRGQRQGRGQARGQGRGLAGYDSWSQGVHNARGRIAQGLVVPVGRPSFRLSPEARVFHIGPWLARQLEVALSSAGCQATSLDPTSPLPAIRTNPAKGLLNKFTPASVQQELDWAAGEAEFPREVLIPLADAWADPTLTERAPLGALEIVTERRDAISAYFARAFAADLVVITLDTTETWFDRKTRIALNGPPLLRAYRAEPDRFLYRRVGYDEVSAHLKAIFTLLRKRNARQKIVLAVSPVPLERTYATEDVIVASQTAKSTLHAAATQMAASAEEIDYFPAYEAVTNSDPVRVWQPDRRSIRDEMVGALTAAFIDRYGLVLAADSKTAGNA